MKVLFDRKSLQASTHLADRLRLSTFLTELLAVPMSVSFSSRPTFTSAELDEFDVLVITTRAATTLEAQAELAYSQQEIADIVGFVAGGGGLLLMSNHADVPAFGIADLRLHDAELAAQLGVTVERSAFSHVTPREITRLTDTALNAKHPILAGGSGHPPVEAIAYNNGCSLVGERCEPIVAIGPEMLDRCGSLAPAGRSFAVAASGSTESSELGEGRVVVVADSGFICSEGTTRPGPGLAEHDHNLRFVMNAILWLGQQLG